MQTAHVPASQQHTLSSSPLHVFFFFVDASICITPTHEAHAIHRRGISACIRAHSSRLGTQNIEVIRFPPVPQPLRLAPPSTPSPTKVLQSEPCMPPVPCPCNISFPSTCSPDVPIRSQTPPQATHTFPSKPERFPSVHATPVLNA
jgi:hypothetical protein